ncbi:MAG: type II toxin-antitoxin system VapC family toxin [Actinobacteria bacterium]|nr:type II toxin-antitoxin system VapC family toxin [Actinomycetota bacterium]
MPTRSDVPDVLVDTSVAVALVVADHQNHEETLEAIGKRRLGLAGHAAFETFSVLTRLPPPARRSPAVVAELLAANFPGSRYLSASAAKRLMSRLVRIGIAGGSVYDALVGAAAKEHGLVLATRDRRAIDTYRALDVSIEIVPDFRS